MKAIKKIALSEPLVDSVITKQIRSSVCTFFDLDLYKAKTADLCFANKYQLMITKTDTIHALACWFEAGFMKLQSPVILSTGPFTKSTHWGHTIFYLNTPVKVFEGTELQGSIAVRKNETHFRDLDIKISIHYGKEGAAINYNQLFRLT